jgi:hypothetical protein
MRSTRIGSQRNQLPNRWPARCHRTAVAPTLNTPGSRPVRGSSNTSHCWTRTTASAGARGPIGTPLDTCAVTAARRWTCALSS